MSNYIVYTLYIQYNLTMTVSSDIKDEKILIRLRGDLKQAAEEVFGRIDMSTSEAIRLFLHAVVADNKFPFDINSFLNEPRSNQRSRSRTKKLSKGASKSSSKRRLSRERNSHV